MRPESSDCPQLISLAVHELRTPVSVASGYVRMVLQVHGQALNENAQKYLLDAAGACAKLGELLGDMSELARLMAGQIALNSDEVAIFELAAEVAAGARDGAPSGVQVEVSGADPLVRVVGDAGRLRTSLTSIVAAALREQIPPAILGVECRVVRTGRGRSAVVAAGEVDAARALASLPPSRWGPFDAWRGGVGFSLPLAVQIVAAHRGGLGSLPSAPPRTAAAVALPILE